MPSSGFRAAFSRATHVTAFGVARSSSPGGSLRGRVGIVRDATTAALSAAYAMNRPSRVAERRRSSRTRRRSCAQCRDIFHRDIPCVVRGNAGPHARETTRVTARNASVFNPVPSARPGTPPRARRERVVRESTRVAPSRDSSNVVSNVVETTESRRDPDAFFSSPDLETRASATALRLFFSSSPFFLFLSSFLGFPKPARERGRERAAPRGSRGTTSRGAKPSSSNAGYSSTGPASSQVTTASGLVDARASPSGALSSRAVGGALAGAPRRRRRPPGWKLADGLARQTCAASERLTRVPSRVPSRDIAATRARRCATRRSRGRGAEGGEGVALGEGEDPHVSGSRV